jgi:phosphoribosyl 1,2-cyclic phosphodiesterase
MLITFWGTRGSIPTFNAHTQKYGGNTPCITVEHEGILLILDAGSGIRTLGEALDWQRYDQIHLLLTHFHIDHVQGFGFFKPFFHPDAHFDIWGPGSKAFPLKDRLTRYLSPPLFPVRLRDFPSTVEMHHVNSSNFDIADLHIQPQYICHPGPTVGYRISVDRTVIAFIPDHEPALGSQEFPWDSEWISGIGLAEKVDLLIHDGQFTAQEYSTRRGWGHSAIPHAVEFGQLAEVKRLVLFHHDPGRTDDEIDTIRRDLGKQGYDFPIDFARERESIEV